MSRQRMYNFNSAKQDDSCKKEVENDHENTTLAKDEANSIYDTESADMLNILYPKEANEYVSDLVNKRSPQYWISVYPGYCDTILRDFKNAKQ